MNRRRTEGLLFSAPCAFRGRVSCRHCCFRSAFPCRLHSPGFTVVELICILAVVALLAALLMPSLSRVRRIATRVVCSTGMRAFGTVGAIYLNDSEGRLPDARQWLYSAASDSDAHPMGCRWHDQRMDPQGRIMQDNPAFRGAMWEYMYDISYSKLCPEFRDIDRKSVV